MPINDAPDEQRNPVDHPKHYHPGRYEVIDVIEAWGLGFSLGNTVKYIARHKLKGAPLEDLRKARWYLERAIAELEREATRYAPPAPPCDRCEAPNARHGLGQYLLCDACKDECNESRGGWKVTWSEAGKRRAAARAAELDRRLREAGHA